MDRVHYEEPALNKPGIAMPIVKHLFSARKNVILTVVYILLIADVIQQFINQAHAPYNKESWQISEWLINYQGGFVRRGLAGEILLALYHAFGVSPYKLIIGACLVAYLAVAVFFIYTLNKKGYSLFALPFVFFLGCPVIDWFWVRKDLVIILFFIGILYFASKRSGISLVLTNLLLVIALLLHEAIGLFCLPLLVLFFSDGMRKTAGATGLAMLKLLPAICTFMLTLYFKGSPNGSSSIWASWKDVPFPYQSVYSSQLPSAIEPLSWPISKELGYLKHTLTDFYNGVYAPLAWLIVIVAIYYILTNINRISAILLWHRAKKEFNILVLSNILLLQFICVMPLFILGCDFGRWIFYWIASSFVVYLLLPEDRLSIMFPVIITKLSVKLNAGLNFILPRSAWFACLLPFIIGFPAITSGPGWQIGLDGFYGAAPVFIAYKVIAYWAGKCILLF